MLIGLSYVASAGQITGRARGTREGGDEASSPFLSSPFLSSCVLDICSFAPTKKAMITTMRGDYSGTFIRASKYGKNLAGGGGEGRGINGSFMLHWFF